MELSNEQRIALERKIVRGLIRHLKKAGFVPFRTYDGEAWEYPTDEKEAMANVFAVDEISLRFIPASCRALPESEKENCEHGVLLVLGNGEDVISDWNYFADDRDGFDKAMDAYLDSIAE